MNKTKILSILKNSITIVLTVALISFFVLANGGFSVSRADDDIENEETETEQEETELETEPLEEDDDSAIVAFTLAHGEGEEAVVDTYPGFEEAIAGACAIFAAEGQPIEIEVKQSVNVTETVAIDTDSIDSSELSLTINFAGNTISFAEGVCFDAKNASVTLKDSSAGTIEFDGTTDNARPGGMLGESGQLIATAGNVTIESGYYRISNGVVVAKEEAEGATASVTINGGYVFSQAGCLTSNVDTLAINDGFLMYDSLFLETEATNLVLPEQKTLEKAVITLENFEVSGYKLGTALLKLTLHLVTDQDFYFANFTPCIEEAARLSANNDGALVSITPCIDNAEIIMSQTCNFNNQAGPCEPNVELVGLTFKKSASSGSVFDQTMFDVRSGNLTFKGCLVDGYISEEEISAGSMIAVEGGASLTLCDLESRATSIVKNTGLKGAIASDPCAGIWLKPGASLKVSGNVAVNNNIAYTGATESSESKSEACNVYMADSSRIIVEGPLVECETFLIGISMAQSTVNVGTVIGSLGDAYYSSVSEMLLPQVDLSAFGMDQATSYELRYSYQDNEIYWNSIRPHLAEAGVMRIEFFLLFMGLIGFIMRNLPHIRGNEGALRYITGLSVVCLIAGAVVGFYHIKSEELLVARNNEIVAKMFASEGEEEKSGTSESIGEQEQTLVEEVEPVLVPEDGREYIGIIEIEALDIKLPVLAQFTDADMKTTPCVYYGCRENNDLVIVGHNYDSQFGDFNKLSSSDQIKAVLTLLDGSVIAYDSIGLEYLNPDQVEEMLSGDWDMTLYTCNYAGDKRIAIRFNYSDN